MLFKNEQGSAIELRPSLLGVSVFYAAFLLVTNYSGPFSVLFGPDSMVVFLEWAVVAGILCAVCFLVTASSRRKLCSHETALRVRIGGALAGFVCFSAGGCIMAMCSNVIGAQILGGLLFGAGTILELVCWGALYSQETPQSILLHTALSTLIASAFFVAVSTDYVPRSLFSTMAAFLLFGFISAIILCFAMRSFGLANNPNATELTLPAVSRAIWSVLWKPLLGALLAAFILGLTWNPNPAGESDIRALKSIWRLLVGPAGATAIVLFLLMRNPKSFTLHALHELLLPIAIVLLMVSPFFKGGNAFAAFAVDCVGELSFSIVVIVIWTSMAASIRTTDASARVVFPISLALLGCALVVGLNAIWVLGVVGKDLCLAITVIYLIVLIVSFAQGDEKRSQREIEKSIATHYLDNRADEMARTYKLSEREREVLGYLCRGYSQVYIAKELYISENTARTHVKHIYTKAGVHSREELLEMIDGIAASSCPLF